MKQDEDNALEALYRKNGIDLKKTDTQYNKYGLLTIDKNFTIFPSDHSRVLDERIVVFDPSMPTSKTEEYNIRYHPDGKQEKNYLFIEGIGQSFLSILDELLRTEQIKLLALSPNKREGSNYKSDIQPGLEAFEQGKKFSLENLGIPLITQLYSDNNYENKLWINIDSKNITFEEMVEDFETDEENIITQVIHLQYFKKDDDYFISHLDHEFIFYTTEEYENRATNHKQKGEARTRFKTFKIDDSRIPFILENGIFFLYIVLDQYFKNKDLLQEYFEKVLKSKES